jgi:hypothetical protein
MNSKAAGQWFMIQALTLSIKMLNILLSPAMHQMKILASSIKYNSLRFFLYIIFIQDLFIYNTKKN